jgi:hypothetical protein
MEENGESCETPQFFEWSVHVETVSPSQYSEGSQRTLLKVISKTPPKE